MRERLLKNVGEILVKAGYIVFLCIGTKTCFDVIGRRNGELMLVKVLENIDGITERQARDLRKLSAVFGGKYILVGRRTKEGRMKDGVVYERYGIPSMSLRTFGQMVVEESYPNMKMVKRLVVNIDGRKMAERRRELNMTLKALSKLSEISIDTLYRYEHGRTGASVENIRKIERILGTDVRKPFELFVEVQKETDRTILSDLGFESVRTTAAPFEVAGKKREKLILGEDADRRTLIKRAKLYKEMEGVLKSSSCFLLCESKKDSMEGIPIVRRKELEELEDARELMKLIKERGDS